MFQNPVEDVIGVLWMIHQPLLFGLIGSVVDISALDANTVGKSSRRIVWQRAYGLPEMRRRFFLIICS